MLADSAEKRILSNVSGQHRSFLNTGAATYGIAIEVELVEKAGQAISQRLAIEDKSRDLRECSRTN